jgi:hypothetical protein
VSTREEFTQESTHVGYPGGRGARQGIRRDWDRDESKPFFMTSEFWAAVAAVTAIVVAAAVADNFEAPRAWTLVAIVVGAYIVSRGLAKSGTEHRD